MHEAFAKDLAEVSFRIDETIGLNATNSSTRESLRTIRAQVSSIIKKSEYMMHEQSDLTPREHDVLAILGTGASIKEIADALFLSQPTVKTHLNNLYRKLGASSKIEAVNRAKELSLLS